MKKEDIQPWDWQRILFGQAPPEFLIEVFLRTTLIYLALLVVTRALGKRMGGQLSISELAVMVTLGAIVSPAMQIPQLGLLLGVMILTCALLFQRGLGYAEFKSRKIENMSQGTTQMVVKDGTILLKELGIARISHQQLYAALRDEGIYNLGEAGRVYIEAFGCFSVFKRKDPLPGLCILPPSDRTIASYSQQAADDRYACTECGQVTESAEEPEACHVCNAKTFIAASTTLKREAVTL